MTLTMLWHFPFLKNGQYWYYYYVFCTVPYLPLCECGPQEKTLFAQNFGVSTVVRKPNVVYDERMECCVYYFCCLWPNLSIWAPERYKKPNKTYTTKHHCARANIFWTNQHQIHSLPNTVLYISSVAEEFSDAATCETQILLHNAAFRQPATEKKKPQNTLAALLVLEMHLGKTPSARSAQRAMQSETQPVQHLSLPEAAHITRWRSNAYYHAKWDAHPAKPLHTPNASCSDPLLHTPHSRVRTSQFVPCLST